MAAAASNPDAALIPRRWRLPARAGFLLVLALILWLYAFGLPEYYRQLTTVCPAAPCGNAPTTAEAQLMQAAGVSVVAAARWVFTLDVLMAVTSGLVALLLFWRRGANRMAWFTALTLLTFGTFGIHDIVKVNALAAHFSAVWRLPVAGLSFIGGVSILVFFLTFPDGRFAPRWLRWPLALWLVHQVVVAFIPGTPLDPARWPLALNLLYWAVLLGVCVYSQVYRYRRVSNYAQRQQTKWVVLGIAAAVGGAFGGYLLLNVAGLVNPAWAVWGLFADSSYYLSIQLLPLSIAFALLRSGLWDVDVLINRALVYGLLTVLLAGLYGFLVIGLQALFTQFTGQTSDLALIGSTLAIVALFQPLRRGVAAFIARRFYRRHYDGQQVLTAFAGVLRDQPYTDPDALSRVLLNLVDDTIQPEHVSLRLVEGSGPKAGQGR
jgi:hypothetical protein